jgi:hypothetical protein
LVIAENDELIGVDIKKIKKVKDKEIKESSPGKLPGCFGLLEL